MKGTYHGKEHNGGGEKIACKKQAEKQPTHQQHFMAGK